MKHEYTLPHGTVTLERVWDTWSVTIIVSESLYDALEIPTTTYPCLISALKRVHKHMEARVREYPATFNSAALEDIAWSNYQHRGHTFDNLIAQGCHKSGMHKNLKNYEKLKKEVRQLRLQMEEES